MTDVYRAFLAQKNAIRRVVAKYRSNPADIEDLTQDVFLAAFAAEQKTSIHNPEHLLLRIAKNLAINETRKKINTTSSSVEDLPGYSVLEDKAQNSPEDLLDGKQKLYVFSQALAELPPELRRAFVLKRVEGLKMKQIAIRLNVSASTVEKRVAAAMLKCRRFLIKNGHDPADFWASPKPKKVKSQAELSIVPNNDEGTA